MMWERFFKFIFNFIFVNFSKGEFKMRLTIVTKVGGENKLEFKQTDSVAIFPIIFNYFVDFLVFHI